MLPGYHTYQALKLLQRLYVHEHVGVLITAVLAMFVAVGK